MDMEIRCLRDLLFSVLCRDENIRPDLAPGQSLREKPSFRGPRKDCDLFFFLYFHIRYPLGVTIQSCPPRTDFSVRLFPINTVVNMSAS